MHYDMLARQSLRLGLIRFTGSQGTAGQLMKAFLNKMIRENNTATVVNLGKGVYGLKEWQVGTTICAGEKERKKEGCPPGPVPTAWQSQGDGCSGAVSPNLEDKEEGRLTKGPGNAMDIDGGGGKVGFVKAEDFCGRGYAVTSNQWDTALSLLLNN